MSCLLNDPHANTDCCPCRGLSDSQHSQFHLPGILLENRTPGREGGTSPALLTQDTLLQQPQNAADHELFNSGTAGSAAQ